MATTSGVTTTSTTGANGSTYTTAVSNDKLTNQDFLKLMLEEMKMQDPTKPMDSQNMLNSQMQMSSIETNLAMVNAMTSLQNSFSQMSISTAANMVGRIVEDGTYNDAGDPKGYMVSAVELNNGEITLKGYEATGYDSTTGNVTYSDTLSSILYNNVTKIY